ncbi:MAG: alpha/beta hydrolase, partial [Chloroflexales bacterium]|nr:alpha/beta hydrolase [Chloroflexales bacterium]
GLPMLLLHGVADSWRSFERVLLHLPQSMHAIALTQRGHGDADRPAAGYRTRDFAADADALLDALDLGPAVVVGHSMGSTNALRIAIDYPERVLGLVIVGSFATYRGNPLIVEFWESTISQLSDPIDPSMVREFQESTLAQPVAKEFLDIIIEESLKVPARVWRASFEGVLEDDFAEELGQINVPTLIVWGDQDAFCPRNDQAALLSAITSSRLVVYEGAGHGLHWEKPERFADDLVAFGKGIATQTPIT